MGLANLHAGGLLVLIAGGCAPQPTDQHRGPAPAVTPAGATLRRLTAAEYRDTALDLFGEGLVLPTALEPDAVVDGLAAVGAGQSALSPLGVERYESAAYLIAEQVASDPGRRASFAGCVPLEPTDAVCAEALLAPMARRAWRRSPTTEELAVLVGIADQAGRTLGTFEAGLTYALAAILQSPHFLYRVEIGEGVFDGPAIASRMAYLLWAGPPDDALLDRAEEGALQDAEVRREEALRMLEDPRARRGLRRFFEQKLRLSALEGLTKDPALFPHWSAGIPAAALEQTLATIEASVFDDANDVRDLFTSRTTFLDRGLAALYGVPAPSREGFGRTELPDGPRLGLLGQVSFLATQAHTVSTSVTRRGMFVQQTLLCRLIPPPPANVDTSIPAPSEDAPTMRQRVARHLEDPGCASCHLVTDPVGLAFERFDGIGRYRDLENGYPIDASGDLDGLGFVDAEGLAHAVRNHPDLVPCLTEGLYTYAQGHVLNHSEAQLSEWHAEGLARAGYQWKALLVDLVSADGFVIATQEADQ